MAPIATSVLTPVLLDGQPALALTAKPALTPSALRFNATLAPNARTIILSHRKAHALRAVTPAPTTALIAGSVPPARAAIQKDWQTATIKRNPTAGITPLLIL